MARFHVGVPLPQWVGTEEDATRLLEKLPNWEVVGIDTETTGLNRQQDRVYFWSLANEDERYALCHTLLPTFQRFLEDERVEFANQNCNFDAHMLANAGISYASTHKVVGNRNDPMVMHTLYKDFEPHGLDWIASEYLKIPGGKLFSYKERFGKTPIHEIHTEHELFDDMVDYASHDAWLHLMAYKQLRADLEKEDSYFGTLWDYYKELECPLHDVLYQMERRGVLIDKGYLAPKSEEAQGYMNEAVEKLAELAGTYVNPASPKQLQALFYGEFGLPITKKTKGGASGKQQGSTDEEVLRGWSDRSDKAGDCARQVLTYRKHQKIKGTYIEGILKRLNPNTGRVHGTFTQHVARTGRLSSRDPNIQNIPNPMNDPYDIRRAFVADIGEEDDWLMLCSDYDQLEMMLAASNSGDANMIKAIRSGKDLHCNTASLMFGIPYDSVAGAKKKKDGGGSLTDSESDYLRMRQYAKTIGFGVLYGEGPKKLSEQLDVSYKEARRLQNKFFSAFPVLSDHIEGIETHCKAFEESLTLLGRRRRLPNATNKRMTALRMEALRQAFNFTIQGFASEIVKIAMLDLAQDDRLRELDCYMLMQVHDELIFECPPQNVEKASRLIETHMMGSCKELLKVDLTAGVGKGSNWLDAK